MKWILTVTVFVYMCYRGVLSQEEEPKPSLRILSIFGPSRIYEVGETIAIYCKLINLEDGDWYNPSGQVVGQQSAENYRVFADKYKENTTLLMILIIKNMAINDSGNYTCKSGDFEKTIYISVGKKVVMEPSKVTVRGNEGETSRFDCEPEGSPEPVVQWYKNRIPIDDEFLAENKRYSIATIGRNRQLEIKFVNPKDSGEYVCQVTQKLLSHSTNKTITFVISLLLHKQAPDPYIHILAPSTTYEVGTTKAIDCELINVKDGDWYNPSGQIVGRQSIENNRVFVEKKKEYITLFMSLIINNMAINDSGNYTCKSGDYEKSIYILVENKPVVVDREIRVNLTSTEKVSMLRYRGKNLPCHTIDYPLPGFLRMRRVILNDSFFVVSSNSTAITFNLTYPSCILGRPDERDFDPEYPIVTGYKIQLTVSPKPDTPPNWNEALTFNFEIDDVNNTLFTATNLTSNTSYNVRACSVNEAAQSEWFELGVAAVTGFGVTHNPSLSIITLIILFLISLY